MEQTAERHSVSFWGRDAHLVEWPGLVADSKGTRALLAADQAEAARFRAYLRALSSEPHSGLVCSHNVGPHAHHETIAVVTLEHDGKEHTYEQSFGFGYEDHSVEFMYTEGNYDCDCNRSIFLDEYCDVDTGPDPLPCGETIKLVKLVVEHRVRA